MHRIIGLRPTFLFIIIEKISLPYPISHVHVVVLTEIFGSSVPNRQTLFPTKFIRFSILYFKPLLPVFFFIPMCFIHAFQTGPNQKGPAHTEAA